MFPPAVDESSRCPCSCQHLVWSDFFVLAILANLLFPKCSWALRMCFWVESKSSYVRRRAKGICLSARYPPGRVSGAGNETVTLTDPEPLGRLGLRRLSEREKMHTPRASAIAGWGQRWGHTAGQRLKPLSGSWGAKCPRDAGDFLLSFLFFF